MFVSSKMAVFKTTIAFILLLLLQVAANVSSAKDACSECSCANSTVYCRLNGSSNIPSFTNLPKEITKCRLDDNDFHRITQFPRLNIQHLSISRCNVEHIDDAAFLNLRNLESLDLSFNNLKTEVLIGHIFRGHYAPDKYEPLWNLKNLTLKKNLLHSLRSDVFEHLPNLESLDLSENSLQTLVGFTEKALTSLTRLKVLNLSDTMLARIPHSFIHMSKYLETLDLSGNYFTEIPMELESTHNIEWLSLDDNPIRNVRQFPRLPFLRTLHLSNMMYLTEINNRSLIGLPQLEEFYCSHNRELRLIDGSAFSCLDLSVSEGEIWPPLKVLSLNNNSLRYLDSHLLSRWDDLQKINVQNNPWVCDCENQWIIHTLVPLISRTDSKLLKSFKCQEPIEMRGKFFEDLYQQNYHMRCLDLYNHKPEKDATLLIRLLFGLIFSLPFFMIIFVLLTKLRKSNNLPVHRYSLFSNNSDDMNLARFTSPYHILEKPLENFK